MMCSHACSLILTVAEQQAGEPLVKKKRRSFGPAEALTSLRKARSNTLEASAKIKSHHFHTSFPIASAVAQSIEK